MDDLAALEVFRFYRKRVIDTTAQLQYMQLRFLLTSQYIYLYQIRAVPAIADLFLWRRQPEQQYHKSKKIISKLPINARTSTHMRSFVCANRHVTNNST